MFIIAGLIGRVDDKFFNFIFLGFDLSFESLDLPFEFTDVFILFFQFLQPLPLVVLEEMNLFQENSQHALVLIVLNLLLVVFHFQLILLEDILNFEHMLSVAVHKLRFLAFEHGAYFSFEVIGEVIELFDQLEDLFDALLDVERVTLQ